MKIIEDFLGQAKYDIIQEAISQGRNGTGGAAASLETKVEGDNHKLLGWKWIGEAWEYGRGKTTRGGDGSLKRKIGAWVNEQNITPRNNISIKSIVYLITRKIHKEGTLLKREGKQSGVISNAINEREINKLAKDVLMSYSSEVFKQL